MYNSKEKIRDYQKEYKKQNKEKVAINQKRYVLKYRDKVNAYMRKWRSKRRSKVREWQLRSVHKITINEYNQIAKNQNNCCAICGTHQSEFKTYLCVDHDHRNNFKRGLLCKPCNLILGNAKDSVNILRNAIIYLESRASCEWM